MAALPAEMEVQQQRGVGRCRGVARRGPYGPRRVRGAALEDWWSRMGPRLTMSALVAGAAAPKPEVNLSCILGIER